MKKIFLTLAIIAISTVATFASSKSAAVAGKGAAATTVAMAGAFGLARRNNMEALEQEAMSNLSNFNGYESDYDGYDDDMLDFNGENSFQNEAASGRVFTFTITNTGDAEERFYISGGYKYKNQDDTIATGVMKDGAFKAIGRSTNTLTAASSPVSVDEFRRFIELNPTRVLAFKLGVSDESQIESMVLEVEKLSPFRKMGTDQIRPSVYRTEGVFQNKIITVPVGFDLNNQIAISANILPGKSVTFTVVCGAILNTAQALENKRNRATKSLRSKRA